MISIKFPSFWFVFAQLTRLHGVWLVAKRDGVKWHYFHINHYIITTKNTLISYS